MSEVDEVGEWARAQERVLALVGDLPAERMAATVPACPDWSVHDLLAHMVGLGADVVAGNEPDDHHEEWTRAQVRARRDRPTADVLDEWRGLTTPLCDWMREHGTRPLGDVIIHEQDLRGAVGVSGGRDTDGLRAVRDRFTGRLAGRLDGLPPLALRGERWRWASDGSGNAVATDDADADAAVEVDAAVERCAAVVAAPDFELARALVTRRSADQLRAWTRRGDLEPYLEAFALLGPLPDVDLAE